MIRDRKDVADYLRKLADGVDAGVPAKVQRFEIAWSADHPLESTVVDPAGNLVTITADPEPVPNPG